MSNRSQLLDKLIEAASLCEGDGFDREARWFSERVSKLRKSNSTGISKELGDIDRALAGMGSFSDLPLNANARERQWALVDEIAELIAATRSESRD